MSGQGILRIWMLVLGGAIVVQPAWCQNRMGGMMGGRGYNAATEVTLAGTVEAVHTYGQGGTHVTLKTGQGELNVALGPSTFLAEKHFSVAKGDHLEVTGSKVTAGGSELVLARLVKKGDEALTLRDPGGIPQWSGAMGGMGANRAMRMGGSMGMMGGGGAAAPGPTGGKEVFTAQCAKCHNAATTARKIGPGLKGLFARKKLANGKEATEANIRTVVEHGAEGMPGYAKMLNAQQLDELIAYLKTL